MGLTTIAGMLAWEQLRPAALKLVPGALIGVLGGTLLASLLGLGVQRIDVPASLLDAIAPPTGGDVARLAEPAILITALAIAFIASAETLLSAAAVDRMHDGPRTAYNKELFAQGVGNFLCGLAGALPMTGVIVRSSANVQAGAMTRASAIFHGVWLLAFVAALPFVLELVPTAALAGVLVVTGWRLVKLSEVRHMFRQYGPLPAIVWVGTFGAVLATDLLTGVIVGVGLSLLELAPHARRLKLDITQAQDGEGEGVRLELTGRATAVQLPKLTKTLDAVPDGRPVHLHLDRLAFIDHTTAELLSEWIKRRRQMGASVELKASAATERVLGLRAA